MNLNIGYVFDDGFAECSAVSMASILENNSKENEIHFWVLDDGISFETKRKFDSLMNAYGSKISFINGEKVSSFFEDLGVKPWRGRYSAYMKVMVSCFQLPMSVERFVVLDGDTIIKGDLSELFEVDMGECACAMALEGVPGNYYELSGLGKHELFNAGVILYDVKKWEEIEGEKRFVDYINLHGGNYMLPEEDIISRILMGSIKRLSPKFNFLSHFNFYNTDKYFRRLEWDKLGDQYYTVQDIQAAKGNEIICHCLDSCTNRPWHQNNCHYYTGLYDLYRAKTPWKQQKKVVLQMTFLHKVMYCLRKILPQSASHYFFYLTNKYSYKLKGMRFYR